MMGWYQYPKSSPLPVKDGIAVKKKRGAIGEQWWSKRFLDVLVRMGMENRLERGRRYARKGQVTRLAITGGLVHASVQGSVPRPYQVVIGLEPWDENQWKKVISKIADQALYAANLLTGEIPHEIEEVVGKAGVHLFPGSRRDLKTHCDCPDSANPCKHIAAVYYLLAERFDEDPFLIFAMRGKTKEEFLEGLRRERGPRDHPVPSGHVPADTPVAEEQAPVPLTGFYDLRSSLDGFRLHLTAGPEMKGALLKRLGPSPLFIGNQNFSDLIAPIYEVAPEYVRRIVHGDEDRSP